MKRVPRILFYHGEVLRQLLRIENVAIYERFKQPYNPDKRTFEVIIIKEHGSFEAHGSWSAPGESYPTDTQWGKTGWTCATLESAQERFITLCKRFGAVFPVSQYLCPRPTPVTRSRSRLTTPTFTRSRKKP